MVVPEDREGRDNDNSLLKRGDPKLLETTSMSTRKAGGQQETSKKSTVSIKPYLLLSNIFFFLDRLLLI